MIETLWTNGDPPGPGIWSNKWEGKMEIQELRSLYERSNQRITELEIKYRLGLGLSRRDCDDLRRNVQRLGLIARELWILNGKPDDPRFDGLREPIKLSPLPPSMRPLDLTGLEDVDAGRN